MCVEWGGQSGDLEEGKDVWWGSEPKKLEGLWFGVDHTCRGGSFQRHVLRNCVREGKLLRRPQKRFGNPFAEEGVAALGGRLVACC